MLFNEAIHKTMANYVNELTNVICSFGSPWISLDVVNIESVISASKTLSAYQVNFDFNNLSPIYKSFVFKG